MEPENILVQPDHLEVDYTNKSLLFFTSYFLRLIMAEENLDLQFSCASFIPYLSRVQVCIILVQLFFLCY